MPVAFAGRIGRIHRQQDALGRRSGRRIGKPSGISVLEKVVIAVISFDYGVGGKTHVESTGCQLPPELAITDITGSVCQEHIGTVTENIVRAEASAEIDMRRAHTLAFVIQFEFA